MRIFRVALLGMATWLGQYDHVKALEFFTDPMSYDALHSSQTVVDFEGIAPDRYFAWNISPNIAPGVTLDGDFFNVTAGNFVNTNYPGTTPSDYLLHDRVDLGFALDFVPSIRSVGLRIALGRVELPAQGGLIGLSLFKGSEILDNRQVFVHRIGTFDSFVGYTGLPGATRLEIEIVQSQSYTLAIDDLRFTPVPEPSALSIVAMTIICFPRGRVRFGKSPTTSGHAHQPCSLLA